MADTSPGQKQPTGNRTGQNEKQPVLVVRNRNWEVASWVLQLVLLLTWPANVFSMLFESTLRSSSESQCSNSNEPFRLLGFPGPF